jgi:hypothetical protein
MNELMHNEMNEEEKINAVPESFIFSLLSPLFLFFSLV